jgi:hypothetical protein
MNRWEGKSKLNNNGGRGLGVETNHHTATTAKETKNATTTTKNNGETTERGGKKIMPVVYLQREK